MCLLAVLCIVEGPGTGALETCYGLMFLLLLPPLLLLRQIFRRDQATVVDMDSFKALLRSNAYQTDPYSKGDPFNAICSRGDLGGYAGGCYDTKVTTPFGT